MTNFSWAKDLATFFIFYLFIFFCQSYINFISDYLKQSSNMACVFSLTWTKTAMSFLNAYWYFTVKKQSFLGTSEGSQINLLRHVKGHGKTAFLTPFEI